MTLEHPVEMAPEDWLRFVELPGFSKAWKRMKLDETDLKALQMGIMAAPDGPPVIRGTGGLRKLRFAPQRWNVGKRDAARVCYVFFPLYSLVVLVAAYSKARKDDLGQDERNEIKRLIQRIEKQLDAGKSKGGSDAKQS